MYMEVSLFDGAARPKPGHQRILADDPAPGLDQGAENAKRSPVNPYRLTVASQFGAAAIELETAEADLLGVHRAMAPVF
jgi:hypothetical protein